jgi:pyruvate,water dikinase
MRSALKGSPLIDEFEILAHDSASYNRIREGMAYWQLTTIGMTREVLLKAGGRLQRMGQLVDREDVLFLTEKEIDGESAIEPSSVVTRSIEWGKWSAVKPPPSIGGDTGTGGVDSLDAVATLQQVNGIGASKGLATGVARVLQDVSEGSRLRPGDVLVCRTTSPAWTPLFAVAVAVVTETGGMLTHTSITAREYGIPCVVAVPEVTKRIPDGALVRVDGAKGAIEIL